LRHNVPGLVVFLEPIEQSGDCFPECVKRPIQSDYLADLLNSLGCRMRKRCLCGRILPESPATKDEVPEEELDLRLGVRDPSSLKDALLDRRLEVFWDALVVGHQPSLSGQCPVQMPWSVAALSKN
jgi:hypothetical protein